MEHIAVCDHNQWENIWRRGWTDGVNQAPVIRTGLIVSRQSCTAHHVIKSLFFYGYHLHLPTEGKTLQVSLPNLVPTGWHYQNQQTAIQQEMGHLGGSLQGDVLTSPWQTHLAACEGQCCWQGEGFGIQTTPHSRAQTCSPSERVVHSSHCMSAGVHK